MTQNQLMLKILNDNNIEKAIKILQENILKEYSFKKFLNEYLKIHYEALYGYFLIENKVFLCDGNSFINIRDGKQLEFVINNYKEIKFSEMNIVNTITNIYKNFDNEGTIKEIDIFNYINIDLLNDNNEIDEIEFELDLCDENGWAKTIKINGKYLFKFASVLKSKKLNLLLPNNSDKPNFMIFILQYDEIIGMILPLRG